MKRIAVAMSLLRACVAVGAQPISGPDPGYAPVPDVSGWRPTVRGSPGEWHPYRHLRLFTEPNDVAIGPTTRST